MGLNFPDAPTPGQIYPPYKWDGEKWKLAGGSVINTPSNDLPLMDGAANAGSGIEYTRGDHRHPIDSARAPKASPAFTGGVATDTLSASSITAGSVRANNGRVISQMTGAAEQPSVAVHSDGSLGGRGYVMGMFLDSNNKLAFGGMNAAGVPQTNLARIVNTGNIELNGTAVVARDPTAAAEIATKQYTDGKVVTGAYLPIAGGSMTGNLVTANSINVGAAGGAGAIEFRGDGTGNNDAYFTFHRPGVFACNFGLSGADLWMGGWSYGNGVAHKFWTTRNFTGIPISQTRFAFAGDFRAAGNVMQEPYGGAAATAINGYVAGGTLTYRLRYMQAFTTGWYTVAYA